MATKTLQVRRLSLKKQAVSEVVFQSPPKMPASMVKRFPELEEYSKSMEEWAAMTTRNIINAIMALKVDQGLSRGE